MVTGTWEGLHSLGPGRVNHLCSTHERRTTRSFTQIENRDFLQTRGRSFETGRDHLLMVGSNVILAIA